VSRRPLRVADFDLDSTAEARLPPALDVVRAGIDLGADWIAVTLHATADGWGVVHPRTTVAMPDGSSTPLADLDLAATRDAVLHGGRVSTLEEVLLEAHRARRGLLLRIADTRALASLAGGIGVMGGDGPASLRRRFLAVVRDAQSGKRLRMEVPDAPSALELTGTASGLRARLRGRFPNLARAAADADDLVLPVAAFAAHPKRESIPAALDRRGARLWLSNVPEDAEDTWREAGAAGLLVRYAYR
jgi:hypothetical protein